MRIVNPDLAVHPYRAVMDDQTWERMDRVFLELSDEHYTDQEWAAYQDWMFDAVAARIQTHAGTTVLQ